MSNAQKSALAAVFLVAIVCGVLLAANLLGGGPGTPAGSSGPSTSPVAQVSPSGGPSASEAIPPSAPASPEASGSPSASPATSPSGSPTSPDNAATVSFANLKLDAKDDPQGQDRVITFRSRGAGDITALLTLLTPQGTTRMCLSTPTKTLGCKSTSDGSLHATTTKPTEDFTLTLRGVATDTPTIEVAITFPAAQPAVTITNARFDGTDTPDLNGIRAFVTPRGDGNIGIQAEWGGHPFLYTLTLAEQGGSGTWDLSGQESATQVRVSSAVTGTNPWLVSLANAESGFGPTSLTATISWP